MASINAVTRSSAFSESITSFAPFASISFAAASSGEVCVSATRGLPCASANAAGNYASFSGICQEMGSSCKALASMCMRWRSPPERSPMRRVILCDMSTRSSAAAIHLRTARRISKNSGCAYNSLKRHLPWLFTFEDFPTLGIPNTTNLLEEMFGDMKRLLKCHYGLRKESKVRFIKDYFAK